MTTMVRPGPRHFTLSLEHALYSFSNLHIVLYIVMIFLGYQEEKRATQVSVYIFVHKSSMRHDRQ